MNDSNSDHFGLLQGILGRPGRHEGAKALPDEIKYVLIALSSELGPMNGLLVTSGVLTDEIETPARLSLLPRSAMWANSAIEGCSSSMSSARLAEASTTTRFLDLKPATERGCTTFLSLATSLGSGMSVGIVLGFRKRADCTPLAMKSAKTLLRTAATRCRDIIVNILAVTEMLVAPPPLPELASNSDDEDLYEEEWSLSVRSSSDATLIDHHPSDPLSLQFYDLGLEAAFTDWYNSTLTRMDFFGYMLCFCSALFILFAPRTAFNQASTQEGINYWRSMFAVLPSLLFLTPRTRNLYWRYREAIVMMVFASTTQWELHVRHYIGCVDAITFQKPLFFHGFSWLGVLILMFQMRFKLMLPLALTCFAADLTVLPTICSTFYPDTPFAVCAGYDVVKMGLMVVAGPLVLARFMEMRSRHIFLNGLQRG